MPGTRCDAGLIRPIRPIQQAAHIGTRHPVRSQVECKQNSARRPLKQVPGTRCSARSDASKTQPGGPSNRCQAPVAEPGRMLANRAQIGARHLVQRQAGC